MLKLPQERAGRDIKYHRTVVAHTLTEWEYFEPFYFYIGGGPNIVYRYQPIYVCVRLFATPVDVRRLEKTNILQILAKYPPCHMFISVHHQKYSVSLAHPYF